MASLKSRDFCVIVCSSGFPSKGEEMLTSVGKGAGKASDLKGCIVRDDIFPVSRTEEQTREEMARKNPGLEK